MKYKALMSIQEPRTEIVVDLADMMKVRAPTTNLRQTLQLNHLVYTAHSAGLRENG